jgi:hypothetical protein
MKVAIFLFLLSVCGAVHALEVAGVKVDEKSRVTAGGPELVLNGAGLRTKVFFKVYVAGLYLTEKKASAADVLALKGPKRVLLTTVRDLTADQFLDAIHDGLADNNAAADLERLKPQRAAFDAILIAVKESKTGSTIAIDYLPESGTRVTVNGEAKGAAIGGEDFYNALLRVWLGEKPVESSLKRAMLGGSQ